MRELFHFPNPVNEVSARLVAGAVVVMSLVVLVFDQNWILVPLAYGFVARVLTGPTLSPLGQVVTRVVTPALPFRAKPIAGPPKRFSQGIGAAMSLTALVLDFAFGFTTAAHVVVGLIAVAATLESVFAFCIGCKMFAGLMRLGLVPDDVCEACNNIWDRPGAAAGQRA